MTRAVSFVASLVVSLAGVNGVGALQTCEHNGKWVDGKCACNAQWKGMTCGELALLPAPRNGGLHLANYSTWGASVVQDDTGLYHMFASRIAGHCDLSKWYPNSAIVRATSDNALGPFVLQDVVLPSFAHGPVVRRLPGGGYAMFHIGCGSHNGTIKDCAGATESEGQAYCNPDWIAASSAPALQGPWTLHGPLIDATNWTWFGGGVTNPAPLVFPNGSVLLLYRGHEPEKLGASFASAFQGPYSAVGRVPLIEDADEDPFIWMTSDGVIHGITHWMGKSSGAQAGGRHIWSVDEGVSWSVSSALAFTTAIEWDDGALEHVTTRERPQLLVKDGLPMVLYNGLQPTGAHLHGKTWTMAQPINQA
ncbi:hypothetical protein M885DRAFT_618325 [Pelagophyceae sp. CCMP2097]|nr:hypothetical protein M885DRAFT_618325 [Pelagophyceae sp. CCMP2097]